MHVECTKGSSYDVSNHELMDELKVGWIINVAEECENLYQHSDIMYLFDVPMLKSSI